MKRYNVGRGYLVLTDAARYMANKIGKGNDEKVISKIYKEFRNRIKENNFEYEYLGKRIVKVKKKYLDSLYEEFKSIFLDDGQLKLITDDLEEESKENKMLINENNNLKVKENVGEYFSDGISNLQLIKDLLHGKYDDIIDEELKKKLIRQLIGN